MFGDIWIVCLQRIFLYLFLQILESYLQSYLEEVDKYKSQYFIFQSRNNNPLGCFVTYELCLQACKSSWVNYAFKALFFYIIINFLAYFDVSNSNKFQLVFHISQFFMTYKLCPQFSLRQFVLRILFVIYLSKLANPFSIWTKQMNINLTWYFILWRNTDFFRNVSILSVNTNLYIVIRNPNFFLE